jgi:phenylalanyl-tRNA synthetase beta subunit
VRPSFEVLPARNRARVDAPDERIDHFDSTGSVSLGQCAIIVVEQKYRLAMVIGILSPRILQHSTLLSRVTRIFDCRSPADF